MIAETAESINRPTLTVRPQAIPAELRARWLLEGRQ